MTDIQSIAESGKWDLSEKDKIDERNFLLMRGVSQFESSAYDEAINSLCELIKLDPDNQEAYFHRASAYFETGSFDLALNDWIKIEEWKNSDILEPQTSYEFDLALFEGLVEGGKIAAVEFFPSLWESSYGLGTSLWSFVQSPKESVASFCNACYETGEVIVEYIKTLDEEQIKEIAIEIKEMCSNFSLLSDKEKGPAIGYCIGKYGTDIFIGGTALKFAKAIKKLKTANRIANLEAFATSEKSREVIKAAAATHAAKREASFINARIHWDRQNKHVKGKHNYIEGRSVFEHPDAQELLDKFAGTGKPLKGRIPGTPDYREKINFGEYIGYHISDTGVETKTTWGEIRYSKAGAHIIPAFPGD